MMETAKFIGTGALAERLGISNSRIRQLEREGTIPAAQRLMPSDRRMWPHEQRQPRRVPHEMAIADERANPVGDLGCSRYRSTLD
jgi:hypothetical protein